MHIYPILFLLSGIMLLMGAAASFCMDAISKALCMDAISDRYTNPKLLLLGGVLAVFAGFLVYSHSIKESNNVRAPIEMQTYEVLVKTQLGQESFVLLRDVKTLEERGAFSGIYPPANFQESKLSDGRLILAPIGK